MSYLLVAERDCYEVLRDPDVRCSIFIIVLFRTLGSRLCPFGTSAGRQQVQSAAPDFVGSEVVGMIVFPEVLIFDQQSTIANSIPQP
jgi:hypothetical protein